MSETDRRVKKRKRKRKKKREREERGRRNGERERVDRCRLCLRHQSSPPPLPLPRPPIVSARPPICDDVMMMMMCWSGVHHALNPDPYRGVFGSDGEKYARDVEDLITFGTSGHVAGFISEAIQGVGGIIELAPGYLPAVYSSIKKAGGLCIADEVQSGFARTGSHFWGFETQGVVPDMVTMAKGIGNGIPLGAVVTTPEIAEVLTRRSYFNTFGGNPVCTAAGLAVLKVIEREKLQENAHVVGSYLKERLTALKDKHEIIGDVRGRGLMLGVELVTDHQLKTPAKVETMHVMEQMKDMGVLVGKGGFYGNVFRITPPLCFTKNDADFLVDVMDYTMSKM